MPLRLLLQILDVKASVIHTDIKSKTAGQAPFYVLSFAVPAATKQPTGLALTLRPQWSFYRCMPCVAWCEATEIEHGEAEGSEASRGNKTQRPRRPRARLTLPLPDFCALSIQRLACFDKFSHSQADPLRLRL
jgi:hypothetical protein